MATIKAKGQTDFGYSEVIVRGVDSVDTIYSDDESVERIIRDGIAAGEGWLANDYHPEPGTMLQAFAFLSMLFGDKNVTVDGDIGEMENEPGVIY